MSIFGRFGCIIIRIIFDGESAESYPYPDYFMGHCHLYSDRQFARITWPRHTQRRKQSATQLYPKFSRLTDEIALNSRFLKLILLVFDVSKVADMLMGFYLFAIAIQDLRYREVYHQHSHMWTSSLGCTFVGVVAMTSTEVGWHPERIFSN